MFDNYYLNQPIKDESFTTRATTKGVDFPQFEYNRSKTGQSIKSEDSKEDCQHAKLPGDSSSDSTKCQSLLLDSDRQTKLGSGRDFKKIKKDNKSSPTLRSSDKQFIKDTETSRVAESQRQIHQVPKSVLGSE